MWHFQSHSFYGWKQPPRPDFLGSVHFKMFSKPITLLNYLLWLCLYSFLWEQKSRPCACFWAFLTGVKSPKPREAHKQLGQENLGAQDYIIHSCSSPKALIIFASPCPFHVYQKNLFKKQNKWARVDVSHCSCNNIKAQMWRFQPLQRWEADWLNPSKASSNSRGNKEGRAVTTLPACQELRSWPMYMLLSTTMPLSMEQPPVTCTSWFPLQKFPGLQAGCAHPCLGRLGRWRLSTTLLVYKRQELLRAGKHCIKTWEKDQQRKK